MEDEVIACREVHLDASKMVLEINDLRYNLGNERGKSIPFDRNSFLPIDEFIRIRSFWLSVLRYTLMIFLHIHTHQKAPNFHPTTL